MAYLRGYSRRVLVRPLLLNTVLLSHAALDMLGFKLDATRLTKEGKSQPIYLDMQVRKSAIQKRSSSSSLCCRQRRLWTLA